MRTVSMLFVAMLAGCSGAHEAPEVTAPEETPELATPTPEEVSEADTEGCCCYFQGPEGDTCSVVAEASCVAGGEGATPGECLTLDDVKARAAEERTKTSDAELAELKAQVDAGQMPWQALEAAKVWRGCELTCGGE